MSKLHWLRTAFCGSASLGILALTLSSGNVLATEPQPDFMLPLECGITARVSTYYYSETRKHTQHAADLNVGSGDDDDGLAVLAAAAGKVTRIYSANGEIDVDHGGDWVTRYAHMDPISVKVGDSVSQGSKIGEVSNKGVTDIHLHFSIKFDGDPYPGEVQGKVLVNDWTVVTPSMKSANCGDMTTSYHEGSFIEYNGKIFRIVGGAPSYVIDWDHVDGEDKATSVDEATFNSLRDYPKNGTFVIDRYGRVFVFAGGAPLHVQAWANVGGPKPTIMVDSWTIDNRYRLLRHPWDGTFVVGGRSNKAYVIAGGAPMYIEKWDNFGAEQRLTVVDDWSITNELRPHPRNGTVVTTSRNSYVFAGGTALYFSSWDHIGGWRRSVTIDDWELVNYVHAYPYPVDETFVVSGQNGKVYRVFDGTTNYVENWDDVGGVKPTTVVDDWAIQNQLHATG